MRTGEIPISGFTFRMCRTPKGASVSVVTMRPAKATSALPCFTHQRRSFQTRKSAQGTEKAEELTAMTRRPVRVDRSTSLTEVPPATTKAVSPAHSGGQDQKAIGYRQVRLPSRSAFGRVQ